MNVLVLSHMFPSAANRTKGIFVLEQIRALEKLGVCCTVVAPMPWVPRILTRTVLARRYPNVPRRARQGNIEIEYVRMLAFPRAALFALSGFFYYLACRASVRRLVREKKIELIHAHTILPDGFAALLLSRELRLPLVCTLHGSDVKLYPKRSRATAAVTSWALRHVSGLVAVSENVGEAAQALNAAHPPAIIRNGANAEHFHPRPRAMARTLLSLPAQGRILLFVGNLIPLKGAELLLRAAADGACDALLALVGDGPCRTELEATARRLGVCALFAGARPHEEIPLWLNSADCLVLPSFSEGLPTILAEAMLCRTPVIATAVGGTPEIVRNGETGLMVPPSNVTALAAAIQSSLTMNSAQREAMLDRAEQFAQRSLTWNVNARKMLALYKAIIGQNVSATAASGKTACLPGTRTRRAGLTP
jgi:hypothetical protein